MRTRKIRKTRKKQIRIRKEDKNRDGEPAKRKKRRNPPGNIICTRRKEKY
jgi:hypothetical protein